MKLGKKDAKFNPYALRLKNYVDAAYVPPAFADHTPFGFTAWGMMLNGPGDNYAEGRPV